MTLTQETADKCETALRTAGWATGSGCPTCNKQFIACLHEPDCPIRIALEALHADKPPQPVRCTLCGYRHGFSGEDNPPAPNWTSPQSPVSNDVAILPDTPEQKARDLLKRIRTIGTVTELADIIASHERLLYAVECVPGIKGIEGTPRAAIHAWWNEYGERAIDNAWKPN